MYDILAVIIGILVLYLLIRWKRSEAAARTRTPASRVFSGLAMLLLGMMNNHLF